MASVSYTHLDVYKRQVLNELTDNAIYGSQQGASTLEQQLVKNLVGDDASSGIEGYMRKVREIFRAIGLANRYSKETILEAYLNTIPLTGIVCGMEAGAQEYFGKHVAVSYTHLDVYKRQLLLGACGLDAETARLRGHPRQQQPRDGLHRL